jgi:phosphatidylserine/phosphatidylglycerophosphate/cardiolipin synthase-like enzyme
MLITLLLPGTALKAKPLSASGTIEVLFTPWDDAEGAIIRALASAQQSIHVQAYILTSRPIAKALIDAKKRGVAVSILTDQKMLDAGQNSQLFALAEAGIPIWQETRYNVAHNKIILIDATTRHGIVMTGSYNYTWSAQARNAENLLILRNNPMLVRRYLANWQRHQADALPFNLSPEDIKEPYHVN